MKQELSNSLLATIADVLVYLQEAGWKVTKTSLYRHQKEGKFLSQPDGSYQQKNIDKYARTWLKQRSTGKRVSEKIDELQRKKLEIELKREETRNKREEHAYGIAIGKYIPKEQMDVEFAGLIGILDSALKHLVQSHCAEWIRTVSGEMNQIGSLINIMNRHIDEILNSLSEPVDYQIIIDAEEDLEMQNALSEKVENG